MSKTSTTPPSPPRASLIAPWLALGAGLGALALMPNRDPITPAAALTPNVAVLDSDPAVAGFVPTLTNAPSMALPATPAGPTVRFSIGSPSITGLVAVINKEDLSPQTLSRPAQLDRLFATAGNQVKPVPDGYYHPLLESDEPTEAELANKRTASQHQWAELRWCESRGNYEIVNFSGKYRGAYQFDQTTWESVGGYGDPAAAGAAEQDLRAEILFETRGSSPWPYCGRYLEQ